MEENLLDARSCGRQIFHVSRVVAVGSGSLVARSCFIIAHDHFYPQ